MCPGSKLRFCVLDTRTWGYGDSAAVSALPRFKGWLDARAQHARK
jgi:hypothetical protein